MQLIDDLDPVTDTALWKHQDHYYLGQRRSTIYAPTRINPEGTAVIKLGGVLIPFIVKRGHQDASASMMISHKAYSALIKHIRIVTEVSEDVEALIEAATARLPR